VGAPAVSTTYSFQGLLAKADRDMIVVDSVNEFAGAVLDLLEQPELRQQIAQNGRCYIEKHHDWKVIGDDLDRIYRELLH
jgi:polysaccharide biosynthesis protein PslH